MSDIANKLKLILASKRWMKKYFRGLLPEMAYVQVDPEFKMYLSMIDVSGPSFDLGYDKSKAFYNYERADKELITPYIKNEDVFIDVGANIGHFSFYFKKKHPGLTCHLFEPIPWLGDCINQTINENKLDNVTHHAMALSEDEGEAEFFIDTFNDGGHSLLADKVSKRGSTGRSVKVQMKTLDSFSFEKVDFIKVDVQGAEKLFVKGALETIKKHRPKMLIEVAVDEIIDFVSYIRKETGVDYEVMCSEASGALTEEQLRELIPGLKVRGIQDFNFLFINL